MNVLLHSGLRLFWRNTCCTQTTVKGVLHGCVHDCSALKNCCCFRLYSGVTEANAVTYLSYLKSSLPSKLRIFALFPFPVITECAHCPIPIPSPVPILHGFYRNVQKLTCHIIEIGHFSESESNNVNSPLHCHMMNQKFNLLFAFSS